MPRDYDDDDDDRPRRRSRRLDEEEDDDGRPQARRPARRRDYEEEDYDDRPRKKKRKPKRVEQSSMGMVALVMGICSVVLAFVPCIGVVAILTGLIGLIIGFIAMLGAHKSDGRISGGLPIAGLSVSALSVILAAGWLIFFKKVGNEIKQADARFQAEIAKDEEKHKADVAKAASDVKSAQPGTVIRVTAVQFFSAYEKDPEGAARFYENKVLEMTGTVHAVHIEAGMLAVILKGGRDEGALVSCEFPDDPAVRAELSRLAPGQQVTIRGKCLGGDAEIEGCMLVVK